MGGDTRNRIGVFRSDSATMAARSAMFSGIKGYESISLERIERQAATRVEKAPAKGAVAHLADQRTQGH